MITTLITIALIILSYSFGCFSAARIVAKSFKSLNIYKIGTGHPDTENIYENVSKPLGVLVGIIDTGKIYFYLIFLNYLISRFFPEMCSDNSTNCNQNYLLIFGFSMLLGHCLPITHNFKGGRGIFTYIGYIAFFAPYPI
ncbi:MAG: glycerol-3-phosphate acyltransferase, partial [Candidatus Cloacimonetes bacterium]|nr:glycerol-3-phosphate acyltransferase [Candidatus Cloacimonadota bacterium]